MIKNKVILILIDGMRPDGLMQCGNPYVSELMKLGSYTLDAKTVFPSVTLPCHVSLFYSVPPTRHGTTTNKYMPPVHPLDGMLEEIHKMRKKSAAFYTWEPLRDVAPPGTLSFSLFKEINSIADSDTYVTDKALEYIGEESPDFVFLYLGDTDEKGGHGHGWMSEEYLGYVSTAIDNVKRAILAYGDKYTVIITADHGGHARMHGTDSPEDMTVPMIFIGDGFEAGRCLRDVSILDIAPTVTKILKVPTASEWEGKALC